MADTGQWVGITDAGQPLVLADGHCPYFRPGKSGPVSGSTTCWYCQWADFRKLVYVTLAQSICRCPNNWMTVFPGTKNEGLAQEGGLQHV